GHEALGQKTPAACYTPSTRMYPETLPEMTYASHIKSYLADSSGIINRGGMRVYVGNLLCHQTIGMEMIGDGVWNVIFGPVILGHVNARDAKNGYVSIKVSPM
ncbi:IS481 family transposase, partial [Pseudomonas sp. CDFA 550]|nr:IS481 family transposase [Pseudomonas quasicaspiana]